jgi:hypothetical protein
LPLIGLFIIDIIENVGTELGYFVGYFITRMVSSYLFIIDNGSYLPGLEEGSVLNKVQRTIIRTHCLEVIKFLDTLLAKERVRRVSRKPIRGNAGGIIGYPNRGNEFIGSSRFWDVYTKDIRRRRESHWINPTPCGYHRLETS